MNKQNPETVKKIALFMKDVFDNLRNGNHFTMKDITYKHHISTRVSTAMVELRIIDRLSRGRGGVKYIWLVNEPNLKLAQNVSRVANERKKKEMKNKPIIGRDIPESLSTIKFPDIPVNYPFKDIGNEPMIRNIIREEIQKALAPPVKIRKVLKWRNPFYWVKK
jgi:hypothetical protein